MIEPTIERRTLYTLRDLSRDDLDTICNGLDELVEMDHGLLVEEATRLLKIIEGIM